MMSTDKKSNIWLSLEIKAVTLENKKLKFTYEFKSKAGFNSKCLVEIWKTDDRAVVVFSELKSNDGITVVNAAEQLVEEIKSKFLRFMVKENLIFLQRKEDHKQIDIIVPVWKNERVIEVNWSHMGMLTGLLGNDE
jgi:hypothetical protein